MSFFDDIDDPQIERVSLKPLHVIMKKKDSEKLDWLVKTTESLEKQSITRHAKYRKNLESYKGNQSESSRSTMRRSERQYINQVSKFVVNHLYDIVETKVSQMCRIKPHVEVLPTNDEFSDKNAAKAVKMLVNHVWYLNNIDDLIRKLQRQARIFGESYIFIEWDKDKGDIHPDWIAADKLGAMLELLDADGEVVTDAGGKNIKLDKPIKTGDLKYSIEVPWRVHLQRQRKLEDVEYVIRSSVISTEILKAEYPKKADKFKSETNVKAYDTDSLTDHLLEEETILYELWHKKTNQMEDGAYFKFTRDSILEESILPYSHGKLPIVRLTDIDLPEQLNGASGFDLIRPIQNMHNNLSTLLAKNIYLTGHAKWVMPRGACKIEALGNDSTIVQYQGPVAPQMMQTRPNPPEAYSFRNMLVQEMGQVYGVQGVSRGTPPAGITAGVALQFLNEQEQERATTDVAKHNEMIQEIAKLTIAVAGDYYAPDDGRMLRIVGKDNKFSIRHFDSANLSKDYDVRVQVGSALPESKAGKIQRILEIMQMKPDLLSAERWVDLLELGNTEKMSTLITAAIKSAESENEDILAGKQVADPEEYEDSVLHWKTHVKAIQGRSFKEETPLEVQNNMLEHIAITEFALIEKAQVSPALQAKLAELPMFPIFEKGFIPRSREHVEAMVQGQANRGDPITGIIPGKDNSDADEAYNKGKE